MANCRECIHWKKCSKTNGITRYYGEMIAADNVENLCEWFINAADVAPRAEVEMLKEKYEIVYQPKAMIEANAKAEVAREIFEDIEENAIEHDMYGRTLLFIGQGTLAELKKKYTEGQK